MARYLTRRSVKADLAAGSLSATRAEIGPVRYGGNPSQPGRRRGPRCQLQYESISGYSSNNTEPSGHSPAPLVDLARQSVPSVHACMSEYRQSLNIERGFLDCGHRQRAPSALIYCTAAVVVVVVVVVADVYIDEVASQSAIPFYAARRG